MEINLIKPRVSAVFGFGLLLMARIKNAIAQTSPAGRTVKRSAETRSLIDSLDGTFISSGRKTRSRQSKRCLSAALAKSSPLSFKKIKNMILCNRSPEGGKNSTACNAKFSHKQRWRNQLTALGEHAFGLR